MTRLGVNIVHVASLRQARGGREPGPVAAAILAESAGADGIVVHLREDRRHIQDRDLQLLRQVVTTHLNLEMAPIAEMVSKAIEICPDLVTLVPERREELTTEGGLEVLRQKEKLRKVLTALHKNHIKVSIFIDPDIRQIEAAKGIGARTIEIHTGGYANAATPKEAEEERETILNAVMFAKNIGLHVSAGGRIRFTDV